MAMEIVERPALDLTPGERRHLGALERKIGSGLQTFRDVGASLLEIRDARLYRQTHTSFEAYCNERWGMNRVRAYQLIDSAKVVNTLGDPAALKNEAQARVMAPLGDTDARKVWAAVEVRAREESRPVTAGLIRQVRSEVVPTMAVSGPEPDQTDRLVQDITRLGHSYRRWRASRPSLANKAKVNAAMASLGSITT